MADTTELMDIEEACRFFGGNRPLDRSTLYRGIKAQRYPTPVKVGPGLSRWVRSECQNALDRLITESRDLARGGPGRSRPAAERGA